MSGFTHLHTHSHFSLLQALPKIPELVEAARNDEQAALALTDAGNLYGAIQFYQECVDNEIKPIIGVDFYVSLRTRHDKQAGIDKGWHRLVLLAKNRQGYTNLINLVTQSYLEGFYYKPRVDHELLESYASDLIAIIPSFSGDVAKALEQNETEKAAELVGWYTNTYGLDNVYLEVTRHPELPGHEEKMQSIISFARENTISLVAAHDVYYLSPDDKRARDTLLAIQSGAPGGGSFENDEEDFSFITQAQAANKFSDIPDALENTQHIVEQCNLDLDLGNWVFPDIDIPEGKTYDDELRDQVYKGIPWRGLEQTQEVVDRVEYELTIIKEKGYSSYFLIVGDLLRFAHEQGIQTTIRGSVAGSITTYLLGITNVDPLEYKLPFERFLNPDRPKAPDIDMDFADDRRDEVLEYAREKYGHDKVAQIGTFGTMMARGAVRDVARALGYPYSDGDRIAKLIPFGAQGFPVTIAGAIEDEPDLKELYQNDSAAREILDMAQKIEGCARHISVHAAGVVIAPESLTKYVPLQYDPKGEGKLITQFDMNEVEEAGLVKFDFLGIRNLSILANAVERARERYGVEIDIEDIPLDDKNAFDLLAKGETTGLFQLNGQAMTQYLMQLKPTSIHDINAMVALYRPGPMEYIPTYIERKHDPSKIVYLDERLKPILEQSYGVITYQDDVLMIAIQLAGFSWLEADKLRKAMGKKIPEEMEKQKDKMIKGMQEYGGISEEKAHQIWEQIGPFAGYGFNKAHAASYGRVAYQTAYMKANYPAAFMTAVLTAESGDVEKIAQIVPDCERMGIPVLPPEINESRGDFTIVDDEHGHEKIRFGLYTIKNVGEGIAESIIQERDRAGRFASLADFLTRVRDRNLTKKTMEALIKSGAMDELGERGVMLANLDNLIRFNREAQSEPEEQGSLFGLMEDSTSAPTLQLENAPEASQEAKLGWEKELIGLYISGHPLDQYQEKMRNKSRDVNDIKQNVVNEQTVVLGALIEEKKEIFTKKGDRMAFLKLGDYTGSIEAVVFPSTYPAYRALLQPETCVAVKGKVSKRNDETSITVDKVKRLDGKTAAQLQEETADTQSPESVPADT